MMVIIEQAAAEMGRSGHGLTDEEIRFDLMVVKPSVLNSAGG